MFLSVLYYFACSSLVSAAGFGLYYLVDERNAKALMSKATWYTMRTYVQVNEYFSEAIKDSDEDDDISEEEIEEEATDKYIHYSMEPEESIVSSYVNEEIREEIKKTHTTDLELVVTKINNKNYYKTVDSSESLPITEFLPLEKQFIQVEIEQNNQKQCIHEYLDSFYLVNNKLFTKAWLKWYMKRFFSENLEDNYIIHIIDKDVNLFKIKETESVLLLANMYEICKNQ